VVGLVSFTYESATGTKLNVLPEPGLVGVRVAVKVGVSVGVRVNVGVKVGIWEAVGVCVTAAELESIGWD